MKAPRLDETCSCGATFTVVSATSFLTELAQEASRWRVEHRHEERTRELQAEVDYLRDHVKVLVDEYDRVQAEGDDAEMDWTEPLIDGPLRYAVYGVRGRHVFRSPDAAGG